MKDFFKSFYWKLSLIFLLLLLLLGAAQIFITIQSSYQFMREADQKLNIPLARNMAAELKPFLEDSLQLPVIKDKIHYMMVMNPKVEIYLLNYEGKILAFFADPPKKVQQEYIDLEPIKKFLTNRRENLILGEDPREPGELKPFSAARLSIGSEGEGYIYIILGGEQYETAVNMVQDSFIIRTMVIGLALSIIVTGLAGLILFFVLTRRLRGVTRVVQDFERGKYENRIRMDSDDEIAQLARAFNRMADTIVSNMEKLRETDNLRRELIANVSHDLRSPLASIRGYLETILMKQDSMSPEDREKYLNTILDNTVMLGKLVEELFELSKLDARQVQPRIESFSLAELVQDVVLKLRPQAETADIQLKAILPNHPALVKADIGLIERVLSNLIENALKFTAPEGAVKVVLGDVDGKIRTTVSDSGSGIAPEDLPHLFERFYRADRSRARKPGGTGLGLAIAQKILELHHSSIEVESQLNVGTRFWFTLPKSN